MRPKGGILNKGCKCHHYHAQRPAQKTGGLMSGSANLALRSNWGALRDTITVDDAWAGVGEDGVGALGDGAAVGNVGNEHVGKAAAATFFAAGDADWSAVHVHLAVTSLVEPGPGEEGITVGDISGDLEVVLAGEWASTHHGLDGLEGGATVEAEGDLARATVVGSATGDGELVGLASVVLGSGGEFRPCGSPCKGSRSLRRDQ